MPNYSYVPEALSIFEVLQTLYKQDPSILSIFDE